ncbi:MAG: hypothetical protein AAGG11_17680 [Pseudomonadota bacterium]
MPLLRHGLLLLLALLLAGCFNEGRQTLDFGSVSIGQQLIDLKRAYEADAIDAEEYAKAKADMLAFGEFVSDSAND